MLGIQLVFVFVIITNFALARPNDSPQSVPAIDATDESDVKIPTSGVVYGLIFNFESPNDIRPLIDDPDAEEVTESVTSKDETSGASCGKLVRKKRFLNNIIGSALQSLRSDNWRECGRTSWGTTIYTNGIGTACFGSCPERVRCGYGYERGYDGFGPDGYGYGYHFQSNTIQLG